VVSFYTRPHNNENAIKQLEVMASWFTSNAKKLRHVVTRPVGYVKTRFDLAKTTAPISLNNLPPHVQHATDVENLFWNN